MNRDRDASARTGPTTLLLLLLLLLAAAPQQSTARASSLLSPQVLPAAHELVSRGNSKAAIIPAPVSVSPSQYFEGDDGPWSSFAVQLGRPVQTVRLFPGTAATSSWAISPDGCPADFGPGCNASRGLLYDWTKSATYYQNSEYDTMTEVNLGLSDGGPVGFEDITLGYLGSNAPTVSHSVLFSLKSNLYYVGILGIDPRPTNFTNYAAPQASILQILQNNQLVDSLSYGYTAGNQYRLNRVFGSLTLGGYDRNRFIPTNVTFPFNQDTSRDLSVNLQSITTDGGSPSNLLPDGSINILVDSTVAGLWLPESACTAFEQAFGLEYNSVVGYYLVNQTLHEQLTAKNPNVTFTIGPQTTGGPTVDIVLPYGAFDLNVTFPIIFNPNTSYYFPLRRAANSTQYTLGRTFLQEAYLIADYGRQNFTIAPCNWTAYNIQNQDLVPIANATTAASSHSSSLSSGAIAGIVVGVVGGILVLAAAIVFILLRRRRRRAAQRRAAADASAAATAAEKSSTDTGNDAKPFLSSGAVDGELGGGEVFEMNAPHKSRVQELGTPDAGTADPKVHGYSEVEGSTTVDGSEYYNTGSRNGVALSEMTGSTPIYEMAGSEVQEMPAGERRRESK